MTLKSTTTYLFFKHSIMTNTPKTSEVRIRTIEGAKEAEKQFQKEETQEALKKLLQEIVDRLRNEKQ